MDAFLLFVHQTLQKSNVTLVFVRYFPNSTKNLTIMQRAGSSRAHKLTPDMPAPAKTRHSYDHLTISVGDGGHLGFTKMPPNDMWHTLRILQAKALIDSKNGLYNTSNLRAIFSVCQKEVSVYIHRFLWRKV